MRRFLRYLRIAFSVACLIACVLLIALWVRSYYYLDKFTMPISPCCGVDLGSINGQVRCSLDELNASIPVQSADWGLQSDDAKSNYAQSEVEDATWELIYDRIDYWTMVGPHWFLVLLCATFAATPWMNKLKWRFSVRTLLIATTLVAVVLGAIVYAAR
jgi:hypothetical protein